MGITGLGLRALLAAGALTVASGGAVALAVTLPATVPTAAHVDADQTVPPGAASHSADPSDDPSDDPSEDASGKPSGSASGSPVGPDATGPAAFGLCNAWAHATVHGQAAAHSVAFRNLVTAAGGAGNVAAYCATIAHPGSPSPAPSGTASTSATHATGRPSWAGPPSSHPSGRPSTHGHPGAPTV